MSIRFRMIPLLVLFTILCGGVIAQEQDTTPVKIAFDSKSERIDLISGEKVPDFTQAKRGSILFYRDQLTDGARVITFYHDGMREADPDRLILMEKVQEQFSIWRLLYKGPTKNSPRIHNKAVSFIPLDAGGKELDRVFVRLDDLQRIQWAAE